MERKEKEKIGRAKEEKKERNRNSSNMRKIGRGQAIESNKKGLGRNEGNETKMA